MPAPQHISITRSPRQAPRSADPAHLAAELRDNFGKLLVDLRLELAWLDQRLADQAASSGDAVHTLRMEMRMRCDSMAEQLDRAVHQLERMAGEQGGA
jgi:hypothetical protein